MMVVVVGDEHGEIDQAHRGLQTRMKCGSRQDGGVGGSEQSDELTAEIAELGQELANRFGIVPSFVRSAVG